MESHDIIAKKILLDRQEYKDRVEALKEHKARYDRLWQALHDECAKIGHKVEAESIDSVRGGFYFNGDRAYHCYNCGKSGRLETFMNPNTEK